MTWVKGDATPAEAGTDLRRALRLAWSLPYADFYATADLKTAKRIGGILWLVAWVIVLIPQRGPIWGVAKGEQHQVKTGIED